jgi:hypothetical protein
MDQFSRLFRLWANAHCPLVREQSGNYSRDEHFTQFEQAPHSASNAALGEIQLDEAACGSR